MYLYKHQRNLRLTKKCPETYPINAQKERKTSKISAKCVKLAQINYFLFAFSASGKH